MHGRGMGMGLSEKVMLWLLLLELPQQGIFQWEATNYILF